MYVQLSPNIRIVHIFIDWLLMKKKRNDKLLNLENQSEQSLFDNFIIEL